MAREKDGMEPQPSDAADDSDGAQRSEACLLALRAQAAEPGSFDALHARLSPSLLAWARMPMHRHLHSVMDADDFVQEVWIRGTRALHTFDPTRGTFRCWIFKIAKNLSIDLLRQWARAADKGVPPARGGSTAAGLGAASTGDPSTWLQVARGEDFERFIEHVGTLPTEDQLLLVHCGIEEQPMAMVAQRLEISEAAAHKRWQRLRARLVEEHMPSGIIEA